MPILFGGLLIGAFVYSFQAKQEDPLTGELTAVPIVDPEFVVETMIPLRSIGLSEQRAVAALEALAKSPQRIKGNVMFVELQGAGSGLVVRLRAGLDMQFFKVQIGDSLEIRKFCDEHFAALEKPRQKELTAAATQFFADWEQALKTEEIPNNLVDYRYSLVIASLLGGFGYHVQAQVDSTAFRCMHEDADSLYFLLPASTQRFKFEGRELRDGSKMFPGHYTVRVVRPNG